jgi:ketosteroid isomerase-like protein
MCEGWRFSFLDYGVSVRNVPQRLKQRGLSALPQVERRAPPCEWDTVNPKKEKTLQENSMLKYSAFALLVPAVCLLAWSGWGTQAQITQEELVRNTQEIFDAVAPGNAEPFKKYFAEDAMFFDEKGRSMDKAALVKDVQPLPKGYSGTIKLVRPKSHIEGNIAILSYDLDETETIFGQNMTARYHETDTWMRRGGKWQIVAGQVLRYYEDPAPGKADTSKFPTYVGTYQLGPERTMLVTAEDGHLFGQRNGRPREEFTPEASDIFFRKGVEGRILFGQGEGGKVMLLIDRRNNEDVVWKRIN